MAEQRSQARRGSRRPARRATLVVAAVVGLLAAPLAAPAGAASTCEAFGAVELGTYWINNNLWGQDQGTGQQCVDSAEQSSDGISWSTSWEWSGGQHQVKSFTSAVLGWHWGWKRPDTGLPVRLADRTPVRADWTYDVQPAQPGTMNVVYDLWLHDVANPDWGDDPTDEVMVWLYRAGGAGPLGEKIDTVSIAGTTWDLYKGRTAWNVYSFVRTTNTESASLDLADFTGHLVDRGETDPGKYLSSVQAGPEIFTGRGSVTTHSYRVELGGGPTTPPAPEPPTTPAPPAVEEPPAPSPAPTPAPAPGTDTSRFSRLLRQLVSRWFGN